MADKKSFALRIDAGTMRAIEKWANDEFRSVNGQIEWILHRALRESGRVRHPPEGEGGEKETDPKDNAGPPG
ncbi:MAG TPA: hypothetical protein VN616_14765 [Puia sp.]|nr:hypothetical protein [Puia sp.]